MFELQMSRSLPWITREANAMTNYQSRERAELLEGIAKAKLDLEISNQNFSYATDPLLVDMYAYEIKATQAKYRYLLGKARSLGLEQREYIEKALLERVSDI